MRRLALLLAALIAAGFAAATGEGAYPGRNGSLLFLRDAADGAQDGSHIFVAASDGSGLRDVTPSGFFDIRYASWSPDGTRIAFSGLRRDRNGVAVYVIDASGGGLRQVTRGDRREWAPTWSPDGRHLAFSSFDRGLDQIFRSRLDGSGRKVLSNQTVNCGKPEWSPTGGAIVFECGLPGGVMIMRPDGTRERRLTRAGRRTDYGPQWTPDGRAIFFSRGGWIHRVRPDGTGLTRVAQRAGDLAVSPDGRLLAVTRFDGVNQEVFVMRRDGGEARAVTATVGIIEYGVDWQPLR